MRLLLGLAALLAGGLTASGLKAEDFRLEEVAAISALDPSRLKPRTIAFSDHRNDELADAGTGLLRFEDWSRARPAQKALLGLYPGYAEPTVTVSVNGLVRRHLEKLYMYVAEARFVVDKAPGAIELSRYARLEFLEKIDPAIKHRSIAPEDAAPHKDPESAYNRHPARRWCEAAGSLCIESRYALEGRLPVGVRLANKLEDSAKKISESMEFQSELRVLSAHEASGGDWMRLTGLSTPVAGVVEQSIFHVNQVMQFGKFVAVLQAHPADPARTVASVFMVLAVESDVLGKKKEYERVPVLRNLVPSQVLMGNSSFNTGASISAGLPDYSRNSIRAIARLLEGS